ncbi:MAG: helix-turn-helix transcriptional regulator [Candidatus Rokubacteria bacterium]|nr:helix-turn-helix transcriptional regulator [Candidatus Rokubacteria bacterium]
MGLLLRQWRDRRGLSLHALADKAGVSYVTISKIENGRMSPTVALLEKLAAALDIRIRDFFPADQGPKARRARRARKGGTR